MEPNTISNKIEEIKKSLDKEFKDLVSLKTTTSLSDGNKGLVSDFADGVGHISGLFEARIGTKLSFPDSWERAKRLSSDDELEIFGLAVDIDEDTIGCIAFGEERFIKQGDKTVSTAGDYLTIPVTEKMLGRVVDPFCRPLDASLKPDEEPENPEKEWYEWAKDENEENIFRIKEGILKLPIERKAPSVIDRSNINAPMQTGITAVDAMLPIGRGQRMLIIGDRATGKTAIAIDTIVNQNKINEELNKNDSKFNIFDVSTHHKDTVYCIYVAIGRKAGEVRQLKEQLIKNDALKYTTIIAAMANDPAPLLYIAPFSGCTLGEYYRDIGRNALIIYDDLSKHANAYRQISLLLRRPPGREAYPGDIFYLHSRLLERSSKIAGPFFSDEQKKQEREILQKDVTSEYWATIKPLKDKGIKTYGGGSLTALPFIETKQNDYAAYVPTNVISITDGQVYLSDKLFNEGFRPAINIGISVSRVGSKAQTNASKEVSDGLKGFLANYRDKEKYTKSSTNISEADQAVLDRGSRIIHFLKQPQYSPFAVEREVFGLFAIRKGFFDLVQNDERSVRTYENELWDETNKDLELKQKFDSLRNKLLQFSNIKLQNGQLLIVKLQDIFEKFQIKFLSERKSVYSEYLTALNSDKPAMPNISKIFENSLNEIKASINKVKEDSMTYSVEIERIFKDLQTSLTGLEKNDVKSTFKKDSKTPKYFLVSNYVDDFITNLQFNYFIEEKQKMKREFCLLCDKEFQYKTIEEIDKEKLSKTIKEFFTSPDEKNNRISKLKSKLHSQMNDYVRKQMKEFGKFEIALKGQTKLVEEFSKTNSFDSKNFVYYSSQITDQIKKLRESLENGIKG